MKSIFLIIFLLFISLSLFSRDFFKNINIDLYGGYGSKKIIGTEFEKSLGQPDFYGSVRLGYKIKNRFQFETGYSSNRYGSFEYFDLDGDRYMGSVYISRYHNIPMLFRINPYKSLWIGAGTQYSILKSSKYYQTYKGEDYTEIQGSLNPTVWNAYFDVCLVVDRVGLGVNYTRSITPVQNHKNDWRISYFNVYILVDLNLLLRSLSYKYF